MDKSFKDLQIKGYNLIHFVNKFHCYPHIPRIQGIHLPVDNLVPIQPQGYPQGY